MASKAVRDALANAFYRLIGRWPTQAELDDLVKGYDQETGPLTKKAAASLRAASKAAGRTTTDDNIDRIVSEIEVDLRS